MMDLKLKKIKNPQWLLLLLIPMIYTYVVNRDILNTIYFGVWSFSFFYVFCSLFSSNFRGDEYRENATKIMDDFREMCKK